MTTENAWICGAPASVLNRLGVEDPEGRWSAGWDLSMIDQNTRGESFLSRPELDGICSELRMGRDAHDALADALDLVLQNPLLDRLGKQCRFLLYHAPESLRGAAGRLPKLPDAFGPRGRLFTALVVLSGYENLRVRYQVRGIPDSVLAETLQDMEIWMRTHRRLHGEWGFTKLGWLENHCRLRLFGLGRLQFEMCYLNLPFVAFRHVLDCRVVVMPRAGEVFGPDGQFADADGRDPHTVDDRWTARLEIGADMIVGHPVSPASGSVEREPVRLPTAEWRQVLAPEVPILAIHMPESGPMDHEACGESMRRAVTFFADHFPEHRFNAFACHSWLLDPQLARRLDPGANIPRFQREVYLVPVPGASDRQTFERVFDGPVEDPTAAPRDTSLRRAILDHVTAGGRWRDGGCLFFAEDLNWGGEAYRAMGPAGGR